jgi:diguanylate cyclase (GGDEF)-like protein/PAS domain S-box-containing protein
VNLNDGTGPAFTLAGSDLRMAASQLLDTLPDAIVVVGADLSITYLNRTARSVFGGGDESLAQVGLSGLDVIHPDDQAFVLEKLAQILANPGERLSVDFRVAHFDEPDGWKPVEASCTNLLDDPDIRGLVVSFRDRKLEHVMTTSAQRLGRALERTSDLLFLHDREGNLLFANASARSFLGPALVQPLGGGWPYSPRITRFITKHILPAAKLSGTWEGEVDAPDSSGTKHVLSLVVSVDSDGTCVITARDITAQKRYESDLAFRANHDALTGLPNRAALVEFLEKSVSARSAGDPGRVAVLFVDLDRFKLINDSLGHHYGDQMLTSVAERFQSMIRQPDILVRLGGDEFVVIVHDPTGTAPMKEVGAEIAGRLHSSLREPIMLGGTPVWGSVSIGIAIHDGEMSGNDLLRRADLAMFRAKTSGRSRTEWFVETMATDAERGFAVESQLHRALQGNELFVAYQPVVRLPDGMITGFEALVRWRRDGEVIEPGLFLSIAQESELIMKIDSFVLNEACQQLMRWSTEFPDHPPMDIAVNLSARQLARGDLVEVVSNALTAAGMEADRLVLEITEGNLMTDLRATVAALEGIRDLGVRLAIDDFGTGYSSLSYLQRFGAHTVKIDRSFIEGTDHHEPDMRIVEAIVGLANTFGMTTIAEGVETPEQLATVKGLGCDAAQGFYLSRPIPADEAALLLAGAADVFHSVSSP